MRLNIGIVKAIFDREMTYAARFNFFMIAYLFFKDIGFHWWYLLVIPAAIVWVYIDLRFIMPKEMDYISKKNPMMRQLIKNTQK